MELTLTEKKISLLFLKIYIMKHFDNSTDFIFHNIIINAMKLFECEKTQLLAFRFINYELSLYERKKHGYLTSPEGVLYEYEFKNTDMLLLWVNELINFKYR